MSDQVIISCKRVFNGIKDQVCVYLRGIKDKTGVGPPSGL